MTGGWDRFEIASDKVETCEGGGWSSDWFPRLPTKVAGHCFIKTSSSALMVIGGMGGDIDDFVTGNTYFYSVSKRQWRSGPPLQTPRAFHSSGILNWNNPETGELEKMIVVAGGVDNNGTFLSSVELLNLGQSDWSASGWRTGPELIFESYKSTMVEFQGSVIIVGNDNQSKGLHLYQLSSPNEPWAMMKQTLKTEQFGLVSFLVPDEIVNCQ
jgi:hypothetical protein